jgi:hypothetical protein
MRDSAVSGRMTVVQRGRRLEYFTIGWNAIEGGVAVAAGAIAGGIALVGFGLNSFIEVTSGLTLPWRMSVDADVHRRELNEKRALRIVGASCCWPLTSPTNLPRTCDPGRRSRE